MTSNPMTNDRVYEGAVVSDAPMTVAGTVNKTMGLLAIVIAVSFYTWNLVFTGMADKLQMLMMTGLIAGFILALITAFKPRHSKPLSIAYAACEGLVLGGISAMYERAYDGIVFQAVLATFAAMFGVLILFKAKIIRATERFRSTIMGATLGIAIFYGVAIILSFFGKGALAQIISANNTIGLVISGVITVVAALNFILDFDFVEKGAEQGAPKYLEWYGAFSLLVTLIWLYLEILRLLAKLNSRR